ncbi:MAG: diadenosine tetraphosphatase [Caulobacteraceae bacterium]|nr:diadenosine tetraphosphatase [Caulobacteraceae bacterium]
MRAQPERVCYRRYDPQWGRARSPGLNLKLFRKKPPPARAPSIPEPQVVYAVGDMHGQGVLVHALLQSIADEIGVNHDRPAVVVTLGDYVDRGPHSKYVLDLLVSLRDYGLIGVHFLKGNHEAAMLDFLSGEPGSAAWLEFGGRQTLDSYKVEQPVSTPESLEKARLALADALPPAHRVFLENLELSCAIGDYFFSHAGAAPGVALDLQTPEDLMWIRGRFLHSGPAFEKMVVHGHSPTPEPHIDHRRIGIDTGAYLTGVLTAVRLEGEERRLIQAVRQPDDSIIIRHTGL